jgi:hypothetical protein
MNVEGKRDTQLRKHRKCKMVRGQAQSMKKRNEMPKLKTARTVRAKTRTGIKHPEHGKYRQQASPAVVLCTKLSCAAEKTFTVDAGTEDQYIAISALWTWTAPVPWDAACE